MKDVILSPPIGSWLKLSWATSVVGTFTYRKRQGKWLQGLKTIRSTNGGWVNKVGLKNPGLENPDMIYKIIKLKDSIISIHGFSYDEWLLLCNWFLKDVLRHLTLELNVSCPNVITTEVDPRIFEMFSTQFENVIVKLPPNNIDIFRSAYANGIRSFHCCNTLPTNKGGESGSVLKPFSLKMIEQIRKEVDDVNIIGGGGIYTPTDIDDYLLAGADKISLSTVFFTPWKVLPLKRKIEELYNEKQW